MAALTTDGGDFGVDGAESLDQLISAFWRWTGGGRRRLRYRKRDWRRRLAGAGGQCLQQFDGLAQHLDSLPLLTSCRGLGVANLAENSNQFFLLLLKDLLDLSEGFLLLRDFVENLLLALLEFLSDFNGRWRSLWDDPLPQFLFLFPKALLEGLQVFGVLIQLLLADF